MGAGSGVGFRVEAMSVWPAVWQWASAPVQAATWVEVLRRWEWEHRLVGVSELVLVWGSVSDVELVVELVMALVKVLVLVWVPELVMVLVLVWVMVKEAVMV
jgi:hypothetical protein